MTSFAPRPIPSPLPIRLAVVGAGTAGLVAARELRREGHNVVVFERGNSVGGTWAYTPAVESDPLGLHPARNIVHSSLYHSVRTNLPRETMGFLDYPFVPRGDGDARRFPSHEEVLRYLENFAEEFKLLDLIRFGTEVERVEREVDGKRWIVKSGEIGNDGKKTREVYDCVVVCNGHYTEPHIAEIPGIGAWPGKLMHSHNYRVPEPFIDQVVIIIGNSNSSVDISRDVAPFAKEVHIACRSITGTVPSKVPGYENMWFHSMIERAQADGSVVFHDGSSVCGADIIIHCTGYKYHFPFLETNGVLTVDDNCVGPLYKHVFPPQLAPSLSFIGIPFKVIPFPLCELQSKWLAGILSGRIDLPSEEEMIRDVKADYKKVEMKGLPKRYAHNLSDVQFEYADWLAEQCGLPPVEDWRKALFVANRKNKAVKLETYRDEWDDDHLVKQAYKFFDKLVLL